MFMLKLKSKQLLRKYFCMLLIVSIPVVMCYDVNMGHDVKSGCYDVRRHHYTYTYFIVYFVQ